MPNRNFYNQYGRRRQLSLQSVNRRHSQGTPRPRDRRPRRRDGQNGRRVLSPEPNAQQGKGSRRPFTTSPDRSPQILRHNEAQARAATKPRASSGGNNGNQTDRLGLHSHNPNARRVRRQSRDHRHRHLPRRQNLHRRGKLRERTRRNLPRRVPRSELKGARTTASPIQDRHTRQSAQKLHRLFRPRGTARRRSADTLFLRYRGYGRQQGNLPHQLDK